jgi:hypothetical protein
MDALIEIYLQENLCFIDHVACMSYDVLVTMVKNELPFLKKSDFALLLNGMSSFF